MKVHLYYMYYIEYLTTKFWPKYLGIQQNTHELKWARPCVASARLLCDRDLGLCSRWAHPTEIEGNWGNWERGEVEVGRRCRIRSEKRSREGAGPPRVGGDWMEAIAVVKGRSDPASIWGINWWPAISLLVVPQVLNSSCFWLNRWFMWDYFFLSVFGVFWFVTSLAHMF
jgi:hypothetical protein